MQPAGKYYGDAFNGQEGNPVLHALMSILSASFVTCSDGIGSANVTLLSRLYRPDGLLLKPSRPVTAIDAQFIGSVFPDSGLGAQGQVYSTVSTISGHLWSFVTGVLMAKPFHLYPHHIALPESIQWYTYRYNFGPQVSSSKYGDDLLQLLELEPFSSTSPIQFDASNLTLPEIQYQIVTPIFANGIVLLGELSKFVPVSPQRIANIITNAHMISLSLLGTANESISMSFVQMGSPSAAEKVETVVCTIGMTGTATMFYPSKQCN